ncbi:hypothetical protein Taro_052182 [Colocasia esculenta]|uniref:Aminopeptidase N-like N-terminal domain-containing protein n=1 Tax=Colocasia esculenta TaxID=4460 RepID=A0A843XIY9_COLES|nr:hypothetical protein [Colocasia esculenta]
MATARAADQFKGQARLPKFAVPRRYDLKLVPDLDACKFTGAVVVYVDVIEETKFLVLNAADLVVAEGSVSFRSQDSSQELRPTEVINVVEDEVLVLAFKKALPFGEGVLRIGFSGTLNDQMKGFYRSEYVHNGEKKNMAVTQFEPADARRCFPCWDEPAFKVILFISPLVVSSLFCALRRRLPSYGDGHSSRDMISNLLICAPMKGVTELSKSSALEMLCCKNCDAMSTLILGIASHDLLLRF